MAHGQVSGFLELHAGVMHVRSAAQGGKDLHQGGQDGSNRAQIAFKAQGQKLKAPEACARLGQDDACGLPGVLGLILRALSLVLGGSPGIVQGVPRSA